LEPVQLLQRLDSDLAAQRLEKHVTMFYGVLHNASGKLTYANAGAFPFPVVANGGEVVELEVAGRPLNLPGRAGFGGGEATLGRDGRLLIASDGVLELAPRETHRARRDALSRILAHAADLKAVLDALKLGETSELSDDVAVLFVSREEPHHG
jgi:phosphoserine phosphatase RsbU/P